MYCRESRVNFNGQFRAVTRTTQANSNAHSGSFQREQSAARRIRGSRETIPVQRVSFSTGSVVALAQLGSEISAGCRSDHTSQRAHRNFRLAGGTRTSTYNLHRADEYESLLL